MSENNLIYNSFSDFYRINFIGRPTELKKLVEDKYTFITSQKDANTVVRAHRTFYGWQYFGNIIALLNYLMFLKITKKSKLSSKTQFSLMAIGISPIFIFFVYSHFSFWDMIRPIVKNSREISKKLKKNVDEIEMTGSSECFNKDEFQIFFNRNIDYHKYIMNNISMFSCIKEIFSLNSKLNDE